MGPNSSGENNLFDLTVERYVAVRAYTTSLEHVLWWGDVFAVDGQRRRGRACGFRVGEAGIVLYVTRATLYAMKRRLLSNCAAEDLP